MYIYRTQTVISDFEHYLEIINLQYLNQKLVNFDTNFRFQFRIKAEDDFDEEIHFIWIFSTKWAVLNFEAFVKYSVTQKNMVEMKII